jgi:hypothetical protein
LAALLAPRPTRPVGAARDSRLRHGGGRRFGFAAEELLLAKAEFRFEFGDALLELRFPLAGSLMLSLPVGGLSIGFEFLGETGTDRTGFGGKNGRGARQGDTPRGRIGRGRHGALLPFAHRNLERRKAENRSRSVS